jgi:hypothetical protein
MIILYLCSTLQIEIMATKVIKPNSVTRLYARETERKLNPAIKAISTYIRNTGQVTDDFRGYKLPAGSLTDNSGRTWQLQVYAVCQKQDFIKKDEIKPIISKWAIGVRLKAISKYVVDWAFKS